MSYCISGDSFAFSTLYMYHDYKHRRLVLDHAMHSIGDNRDIFVN
jgi:hypothetical protein